MSCLLPPHSWNEIFSSPLFSTKNIKVHKSFFFPREFSRQNAAGLVSSVCGNHGNGAYCNPVPREWGGRSVCSVTVPHTLMVLVSATWTYVCVCVSHAEVMKFGRSPGALTTSLCSLSYMFLLRLQTTSSQWSLKNKGPLIDAGSQWMYCKIIAVRRHGAT